jgi:Flp pilus assembly protein TadG
MENNMKLASELYNKAASFKQDENGTILPLTAIILTGLVLASGAAIDYSRYSSAKNVMNTALDAAILDAGIRLGEGQPVDQKFEDDFNAFFNVNITGRGGFTDNYTIVDFSADPDTGKVSATANASVDTTLMRIAGIDEMNISTESAGIFEQTDNEVTIMLDVTGSMRGSKIRALRSAASEAVNILLPKGDKTRGMRVGLVPYASSINVGNRIAREVTNNNDRPQLASAGAFASPSRNIGTRDCVTGRGGRDASTDTFYQPSAPIGSDERTVSRQLNSVFRCPKAEIQPLTNNSNKLLNDIASIKAEGGTAGHLGVAWSYYMLSENWRPLWNQANKPAPKSENANKIAILMTDGDFNTAFDGVNSEYIPGRTLGPFGDAQSIQRSNKVAADLCENMKNDNITVYSIGFDLDNIADQTTRNRAINLLDNCANDDKGGQVFFYRADNEDELREAFREIAKNISSLRLTN